MYRIAPGIKQNQERRWALRERVFLARGACDMLTDAFLERYSHRGLCADLATARDGYMATTSLSHEATLRLIIMAIRIARSSWRTHR